MTAKNPLRAIAGELRYLHFSLFHRHRYGRLALERVDGFPIVVLPHVFNPTLFRTGELLVRALVAEPLPSGARVLDMGAGAGAAGVAAARRGARVVAVDINPHAVRCSRLNALLNGCESSIDVRQGDLFGPIAGERFSLVLFNPPYLRGAPRDLHDRAWRSPDIAERFAAGLADHLEPDGRALVVLSSDGDERGFLAAFAGAGFTAQAALRRDLLSEVVTVWRLARSPR